MNYKDKITIKKEVLNIYNKVMPTLYKNYRHIDSVVIRQLFAQTILDHVFSKNADALRDRRRRKLQKKAIREEKRTEEIKKELDNFALEI